MGSRVTYPEHIDIAIWSARCDGLGPAETLRRLHAGTLDGLGGTRCPMPERTLHDHIKKLIETHGGDPRKSEHVETGKESEAVDSITRRLISLTAREVTKMEERARSESGLSGTDYESLRKLARTTGELRARLNAEKRNAERARSPSSQDEARQAGRDNRTADPMRELQRKWNRDRAKIEAPENEPRTARAPQNTKPLQDLTQ